MAERLVARQYTLDGGYRDLTSFRYLPGERAAMREATVIRRCEGCDLHLAERKLIGFEVYAPWATDPDVTWLCQDCLDHGQGMPEQCFYCEWCERNIWDSTGYRLNYKWMRDGDLQCIACFQERMLTEGHSEDELAGESIPCDFYNHAELRERGWKEGETFWGADLVRSNGREWREYCQARRRAGFLVLTDQGPTGLGNGYPDNVTVYLKPDPAMTQSHALRLHWYLDVAQSCAWCGRDLEAHVPSGIVHLPQCEVVKRPDGEPDCRLDEGHCQPHRTFTDLYAMLDAEGLRQACQS